MGHFPFPLFLDPWWLLAAAPEADSMAVSCPDEQVTSGLVVWRDTAWTLELSCGRVRGSTGVREGQSGQSAAGWGGPGDVAFPALAGTPGAVSTSST